MNPTLNVEEAKEDHHLGKQPVAVHMGPVVVHSQAVGLQQVEP